MRMNSLFKSSLLCALLMTSATAAAAAENQLVQYPLDCMRAVQDCLISSTSQPGGMQTPGMQIKLDKSSVMYRDQQGEYHFIKGFAQLVVPEVKIIKTEYGQIRLQNAKVWLRRGEDRKVDVVVLEGIATLMPRRHRMDELPLPTGFFAWLGPHDAKGSQVGVPKVIPENFASHLSSMMKLALHVEVASLGKISEKAVATAAELYQQSVAMAIKDVNERQAAREAKAKLEADENHRIRQLFRERFSRVQEE